MRNIMPLKFQPKAGSVVICDFHGFVTPEMVKKRPVVIIAKHKHNSQLVTVVPLSTTQPKPVAPYHHKLKENPLPDKPKDLATWAKCDMVVTVSLARLDRYKVARREYVVPVVSAEELAAIRHCVGIALHIDKNTPPER